MVSNYKPALAINFIWCPSDDTVVRPIVDSVKSAFSRDKDRPFSRELNIPMFFFSSNSCVEIPSGLPKDVAVNNISFVFTSVNTVGRREWRNYVDAVASLGNFNVIPVAIDSEGLGHTGAMSGVNCIRVSDWGAENRDLHSIVALAHEVYRYGCSDGESGSVGIDASINIFLSHAKAGDTGRLNSEQLKRFIDDSNMNRFFDANEISPGYRFDGEIESHIEKSTLLAFITDAYSSRYWCQREILSAKKYGRPIVIVDCLAEYEDRVFPAASNVPCVHIPASVPISARDVLRILSVVILETVRYFYALRCLNEYKRVGWIDSNAEILARPPEIRQMLTLKANGCEKVCYPEPPIYSAEADWHELVKVDAYTPLWSNAEQDCLDRMRVGMSISEVDIDDLIDQHLDANELIRLAQDFARHLLARSAILLYGGDLRPNGFTEFVLDEARILLDRLKQASPHVENHLAWPLYVNEPKVIAWRAQYHAVMETVEHKIPADVVELVDEGGFLKPSTPNNSYIWSRCLTEMRVKSISSSTVRICAGGRLKGYKGKMPGVLEEIFISLQNNKPLFLLGGFGGVVKDVCKLMLSGETPVSLTESWQIAHNVGYSELQNIARAHNNSCDYDAVLDAVKNVEISRLAENCGLDESDYVRLMVSQFSDECIHLVLKGVGKIFRRNSAYNFN